MAPNTRSTSAIAEPDIAATADADPSAETDSSTIGPESTAAATITLTQAQYNALQAQIAAAQLTTGPTMSFAPGPAPATFEYQGKGPKPNKYYGGSCDKYNTFIEQCESNFILEGNNSDAGQVAYRAAFLAGTFSKHTLTEEYYQAHHYQDETVQAYAARLDELAEDIGKVLKEKDRAEKF
ncbi:hypothetical protein MMC22_005875 [Lobaria immixta]|nr:hypothetical protein [Lobaria immixta]